MVIVGIVPLLASILLIWSVEAAARGRLGRNGWIGLRFGALMDSETAWRSGHAAARLPMWAGCLALAAGGVLAIALPVDDAVRGNIILASFCILFAALAIAALLGNRAAQGAHHLGARD